MAVRRFMVDSGGTARLIKRRFVVDGGGVARLIKRRFVIDAGGVARLTYQYALLDTTMTEGAIVNFATFTGFDTTNSSGAGNFGSMSAVAISGGGTVVGLFDEDNTPSSVLLVSIGADPGASYITSVTVGATQKLTSAASYLYSGGIARWSWPDVFGMDGTGTSSVFIE